MGNAIIAIFMIGILSLEFANIFQSTYIGILAFVGFLIVGITSYQRKGVLGIDSFNITDTTWSGPALDAMVTRAVIEVDTILNGCAYILDDVRKQIRIPRVEVSGLLQPYSPSPVGNGNTTVDAVLLAPQKYMLYQEFLPADFETHYFAENFTEDRLNDRSVPPPAEDYIAIQYMKRLNEAFENQYWQSEIQFNPAGANVAPTTVGYANNNQQTNGYYFFDGWIKKALLDATVQFYTYSAWDYTTIRTRMTGLKTTIVNNVLSKALAYKYGPMGLRYLVSYADQQVYEEALRQDTYKNIDSTERANNVYKGHDIVPLGGMPANTMYLVMARPDLYGNLLVGINSKEDAKLEIRKKNASEDWWFIKGQFKVDVNHAFGDQMAVTTAITG